MPKDLNDRELSCLLVNGLCGWNMMHGELWSRIGFFLSSVLSFVSIPLGTIPIFISVHTCILSLTYPSNVHDDASPSELPPQCSSPSTTTSPTPAEISPLPDGEPRNRERVFLTFHRCPASSSPPSKGLATADIIPPKLLLAALKRFYPLLCLFVHCVLRSFTCTYISSSTEQSSLESAGWLTMSLVSTGCFGTFVSSKLSRLLCIL